MSNFNTIPKNPVDLAPTRMNLLETLEKRRFSLTLIGAFAFVGAFSNMFASYEYSLSVHVLSTKLINIIQSLL